MYKSQIGLGVNEVKKIKRSIIHAPMISFFIYSRLYKITVRIVINMKVPYLNIVISNWIFKIKVVIYVIIQEWGFFVVFFLVGDRDVHYISAMSILSNKIDINIKI